LLIEAIAATGFRGSFEDNRKHYRAQFDSLLNTAMATFEAQLDAQLQSLCNGSAAAKALMSMPATKLFSVGEPDTPAALFQESAVGATAHWRAQHAEGGGDRAVATEPSIRRAYWELKTMGAVDGIEGLCNLLQRGQHPFLISTRAQAFANSNSPVFWRHIGALLLVAQARRLNDEFQRCVAALASTIPGVVHKAAPVKQCDRIVDKAAEYHAIGGLQNTPIGGLQGVGRVVDIQRCSLCVEDPYAAEAVFAALDSATVMQDRIAPLRRKSGFAVGVEVVGGYRDVKYNMRFQSQEVPGPAGVSIVEIQVILQSYLAVKKRMHAIYRVNRGDFG
jgi:hypothetical protein